MKPALESQSCSQPCLISMETSPHPLLNTALFPCNIRSFFKQLLIQPDHPSPAQEGTRAGWDTTLLGSCPGNAHTFPEWVLGGHSPCWGHLWDPPAPQQRLSPTPEQPWDSMGPRSLATVAPCITSVIKTWYSACQEQLLRAKSCNALRSKPLIPLTSLARTLTGQGLMQHKQQKPHLKLKKFICRSVKQLC